MPLGLKYIFLVLFDPILWELQVILYDVESDASAVQNPYYKHSQGFGAFESLKF